MKIVQTDLPGLMVLEPKVFRDERGYFLESWQSRRFAEADLDVAFVQDNHSHSRRGVLRGLHYQIRHPQLQMVYVSSGVIFDVAVDLRRRSPTFGRWYGVTLSADEPRQLLMPGGFAHGFCVLSDGADVHYKVSRFYDPHDEGGVLWNDPAIGIQWPLADPVVSSRDAAYPCLGNIAPERLPATEGL